MAKMRVYDLAKELEVQPKELLDLLKTIGVTGKVPSSSIEDTAARSLRQMIANRNNPQPEPEPAPAAPAPAPTFENFRKKEAAPRKTTDLAGVSGDVIEDYRNYEGAAPQDGASEAPAAAPTQSNGSAQAPAAQPTAPSASAPSAPAPSAPASVPQSAPRPSNPNYRGNNGSSNRGGNYNNRPANTGAGAPPASTPAAGAPAASTPPPQAANRFDNRNGRGGGRGGRGGGRFGGRNDREARGPRFGDKDFQVNAEAQNQAPEEGDRKLMLPPEITLSELADKINQPVSALIKRLFMMNIIRAGNQPVGADIAGQLVAQFGYTIEVETARHETHVLEEEQGDLVSVPPVVTIMGHVDHGKTSLLDYIRSANVQSGEAGGITQRIGAYETEHNGHRIVFLDTPGHEAFTRMRARGAHVTDIAILVVAADDGVMPQTREAIDHAKAARVPIIVAMNKMDKADADPNRVKGELAEVDLIPEDYGGDTIVLPVSAKTGMGVQELLDMVLLVAEMQDLKANPDGEPSGTVIEAQQHPQRGPIATVLIHRGTLRVGDHVVVGDVYGRVRAMHDYKNENVKEAGPKKPVSIMGLSQVPHASDTIRAVGSAKDAREQAEAFTAESQRARHMSTGRSLDELFAQIQQGNVKELNLIVKADVQGSVEAMCQSLEKLAHEEVRVKIVSRGAGNVSESDVLLADASNAIIIAFAVGTDSSAVGLADREGIEIRSYSVIYDAINEIKGALEGMLEPVFEERLSGEAEVRALFKSTKAGTIAGCLVTSGKLVKGSTLRAWRNGRKVFDGKLDSLMHVKQNVNEMVAGQECGVSANKFDGFMEGDILQSIIMEQVKRNIEVRRPETATVPPPAIGKQRN